MEPNQCRPGASGMSVVETLCRRSAPDRMTEVRRPLRVMTYNIRFDTPNDGRHAWPYRKDCVADIVRRYP